MDAHRKKAYRFLLYWAMLQIRPIQWHRRWSPLRWKHNRNAVRKAGLIANWLHNLAFFSTLEFDGFEEERFWRDYDWFVEHHPDCGITEYKKVFDRELAGEGWL